MEITNGRHGRYHRLGFAYTRPDGVRVTPVTALGP